MIDITLNTAFLINILINLAVALLIIAAGFVLGKVIGKAMGKFLTRIGAEAVFRKTSIGRAFVKAGYTASALGETVTKWSIYIVSLLFALRSTGVETIITFVDTVLGYIPRFIGSLIIVLIGLTLSDWFVDYLKKGFSTEHGGLPFINVMAEVLKFILFLMVLTIALNNLGVDTSIIMVFANALAWTIAIAVGVAVGVVVGWYAKDRVKEWLLSS